MPKLGQLTTADHEPQPIASFAEPFILPLIYKRMVGAPTGLHIFGSFHETISGEVDVPIPLRGRFCDLLGLIHRLGVARFLVRKLHVKSVWHSIRCESKQSLVSITLFEMPHAPCIQREDFFL